MAKTLKQLREERREEDQKESLRQARIGNRDTGKEVNILADDVSRRVDYNTKLQELLDRAAPLVEQVNALYNQFFAGVESRPPVERRKLLDGLIAQLEGMSKPTVQYQFRFNNIAASYLTYKSRWDKQTKALENGRIKRPAGPKRTA
jgi:hypothetical protein